LTYQNKSGTLQKIFQKWFKLMLLNDRKIQLWDLVCKGKKCYVHTFQDKAKISRVIAVWQKSIIRCSWLEFEVTTLCFPEGLIRKYQQNKFWQLVSLVKYKQCSFEVFLPRKFPSWIKTRREGQQENVYFFVLPLFLTNLLICAKNS